MSTPTAGDLIAQLTETWESIDGLLDSLSDDEWRLPTACPGWTVADQVAHLIGTESTLAGRPSPEMAGEPAGYVHNDVGRFNEAWVLEYRRSAPQQVRQAWREVSRLRLSQLSAMSDEDFAAESWTPVGPGTYGRFMEIRVFDCWVHEQDIRDAVGRPGHEDGPAVQRSFDEMVGALGYVVGKRAAAPAGSAVTLALDGPAGRVVHVTVDGRARVVERLPRAPDVVLRMPSRLFARLACGRADPAAVLAAGEVTVEGDAALGERIVAHLAFTI